MISPKYSLSHYFFKPSTPQLKAPNVINLYLDYNCPFSAKIYLKLIKLIPRLHEKHPGGFQFVFVNVVQPWHPNSVLLHEYSLVVAQLLREKIPEKSNELFWSVSESLFKNIEKFYDSSTPSKGRNEIYKTINDTVKADVDLPFAETDVLGLLQIKVNVQEPSNAGNGATVDVKYFTRYHRTVGVHVTPTVSVNGITNDGISSGATEEELIKAFESVL